MAAAIRDAKEDGNTLPPPPPPKPNPNADDTLRNTPPLPNPDADDTNAPPRTNPGANPNADDSLPIGTRNTPPPLPPPNPVADDTNAPSRTNPGANPIADDTLPIGTTNTPPSPSPPPNPDADDIPRTNPGVNTNADDTLSIGTRNTPPPPNPVADDTNAPSRTYSGATNPAAGYLPLPPRPHGPPPSPPPRLLSRPPPSPSTPRTNANAVASEITAAISDISAALRASGGRRGPHSPTQADILAAVRAIAEAVGSPRTPPLPPPRPPPPQVTEQPRDCLSCIGGLFQRRQSTEPARHDCLAYLSGLLWSRRSPEPPQPIYFVTPEQKNYLEFLEKKRTRLNREEVDLDKRCEEIETFLVTNLTMYIVIMAGGTFVGGSLKDTRKMYFLLGILAVAFFFGTLAATLMVYHKLRRLWWYRFDIWRRKKRLFGLIADFSTQIGHIRFSSAVPVASSSATPSLDFAEIRVSELMSTSEGGRRGPSYISHNLFVGVQFIACLVCLGVMIYWAFLVTRGKMDFMFFGRPGRGYSYSPT